MRVGVVLIPTDPWAATVARARHIEALGLDHLWVYDHLSWRRYRDQPWHATIPWLTGIAALTSRIRVGTMVANPNIRHPLLLAKDFMTLDHISDGRMILGIGAGGTGFDAKTLGQAPLTPGERLSRLEEFVGVTDGLLRGELEDHSGRWYQISQARMIPGCLQEPRVPVVIAAGGPRGLRLTAEFAEGWVTFGASDGLDRSPAATERAVRDQLQVLDEACADIGRDPGELARIFLAGNTDERPLQSLEAWADFAGRYAEIGLTDLVVHDPRPGDPQWDAPPEILDEIAGART